MTITVTVDADTAGVITNTATVDYSVSGTPQAQVPSNAATFVVDNRVDLLVGYVHKIFAPEPLLPSQPSYQDVFHICRTYGIPFLLEVPNALQEKAAALLEGVPDIVQFVDPSDMDRKAKEILNGA